MRDLVEQSETGESSLASRSRAPGRPRDESVDERVLEATLDLLAEKGFAALRVDEVAGRSGVAKSTIYRRWSSLTHLAIDAVDAGLGTFEFVPSAISSRTSRPAST